MHAILSLASIICVNLPRQLGRCSQTKVARESCVIAARDVGMLSIVIDNNDIGNEIIIITTLGKRLDREQV